MLPKGINNPCHSNFMHPESDKLDGIVYIKTENVDSDNESSGNEMLRDLVGKDDDSHSEEYLIPANICETQIKNEPLDIDDPLKIADDDLETGSDFEYDKIEGIYSDEDEHNDISTLQQTQDVSQNSAKNQSEPLLKCPICERFYLTQAAVNGHLAKFHKTTLGERFTCHICGALGGSKSFLYLHLRRTHNIQDLNSIKQSELLNKEASHSKSLDDEIDHSIFHCETANEPFIGTNNLSQDATLEHVEEHPAAAVKRIYTCKICNATFPNFRQHVRHSRNVHQKEKRKIHCSKCNITFQTPEECEEHLQTHPVFCDICNKSFLRSKSLRQHRLIHAPPKHKCPHCDKMFTHNANLRTHIRVHTGDLEAVQQLGEAHAHPLKGSSKTKISGELNQKRDFIFQFCKCNFKCESKLVESTRREIYDRFWNLKDWDSRTAFICSSASPVLVKRHCHTPLELQRSKSIVYTLDGVRVCKAVFCSTLGISRKRVNYGVDIKAQSGLPSPDKRGKRTPSNKIPSEKLEKISSFLDRFPKFQSHYSNTSKLYLSPSLTYKQMYTLYLEENPDDLISQYAFMQGIKFKNKTNLREEERI